MRSLVVRLVVLCCVAGCHRGDADPPPAPAIGPPPELGSRFDPATAGTVTGRVAWAGATPNVPDVPAAIPTGAQAYRWTTMPAAHIPVVQASGGLAGVPVYLRAVDPAKSRPWDLGQPVVLQQDYRLRVGPPPPTAGVAFVRRGDQVTFVSGDPEATMIRARGAAFFTLPFPEPCHPLTRRFDTPGVVELSSGAGMPWMAADLFVVEHPYYATTDAEGRFTLPQVPPGEYELVCRVRSWYVAGKDRDTDSGIIVRHRYAAPAEKVVRVKVEAGGAAAQDFTFALTDFPVPAAKP